ncbi:aminoglycoside phosphotransferase [Legionella beliardensis]|uniref:Aminoglycoside phosphotransferase n=1 Tax=Legionella beliardensis TaxID=91822 RepID=A0A378I572_9GAMM|nr:phosphotransferase [Legionella beliardensis]STX29992.1 aminoglycoside phosphotransferase [Legionella beliardensis]
MRTEHWACNFFNQEIITIAALQGGLQHHLDLIKLADGSQWVCKAFSSRTWLGQVTYQQLLATEKITSLIADELNLTYRALCPVNSSPILTLKKGYGIIRPFYEGNISSIISIRQAHILGGVLARIHLLNLTTENALPFPAINWPKTTPCPNWLRDIINQCNASLAAESWLVSHRDIHATNIVWQAHNRLHLIDWESAGLIHPGIELVGLACNCAGITRGYFSEQLFLATLQGYRQFRAIPAIANDDWHLIWQSWLLWYRFVVKQQLSEEILATETTLHLLKNKQNCLRHLYKS